jgi:hypothetical protein
MTHLRNLHLLHEAGAQVLQDNAIRSRKESQHVHDEVFLVCVEALPVAQVISEIDLLRCTYGNVDTACPQQYIEGQGKRVSTCSRSLISVSKASQAATVISATHKHLILTCPEAGLCLLVHLPDHL